MDLDHSLTGVKHFHVKDVVLQVVEPLLYLLERFPLEVARRRVSWQVPPGVEPLLLDEISLLDEIGDLLLKVLVIKAIEQTTRLARWSRDPRPYQIAQDLVVLRVLVVGV